jgi:drug/metabolite transporter (DMT)-like permease
MNGSHLGELAALATAILWTVSSMAVVAAGNRVGSLAVSFFRLIIAAVLMMAYGQIVHGLCLPLDASRRVWTLLAISGFFGFFLCDVCLFKAMLMIGPRLVFLVYSLTPPLAAGMAWAYRGKTLSAWQWFAMAVTLAGVAWVVLEEPDGANRAAASRNRWRGVMLGLFAAVTSAIGLVFSGEVMPDYHDAIAATLIRVLAALPGYLLMVTLWRRWPAMLSAARDRRAMVALTLVAVMGPFIGTALSMLALEHSPEGVVATIIATMPVLVLPLSILHYHEKVSLRAIGGAVLAVVGVAMLML